MRGDLFVLQEIVIGGDVLMLMLKRFLNALDEPPTLIIKLLRKGEEFKPEYRSCCFDMDDV